MGGAVGVPVALVLWILILWSNDLLSDWIRLFHF